MTVYKMSLVARFSPKNGCNVPDGELLTVLPKKKLPRNRDSGHHFVSVRDPSLTSKFGWVKQSQPYSLEDFLKLTHGEGDASEEQKDHVKTMLSAIAALDEGTPVAATYFVRGTIERKHVFTVHKVIFYHPRE